MLSPPEKTRTPLRKPLHAAPPFRTSHAQGLSSSGSSSGLRALSDGAIIGIAFGAFGGVMLLIGVVIFIRYMVWKSAQNVKPKAEPSPQRTDI